MTSALKYHRQLVAIHLAINLCFFSVPAFGRIGLPISRIEVDRVHPKLEFARQLCDRAQYQSAAAEIKRKIETDSTLLFQAAQLFGGNYHLLRLTNNILADRVGNFSPSGEKIVYARDTSFMRYDDGVFDWYENRGTGIIYFDFASGEEIIPDIPHDNAFRPRFCSDDSILYLTDGKAGFSSQNTIYLYDLELEKSSECFSFHGQDYYPVEEGIIVFDRADDGFIVKSLKGEKKEMLFDNSSILTFKRPLPQIRNISAATGIILFEAGFTAGRVGKNIYGLPIAGGKPKIMISDRKEFLSEGAFYPAAVDEEEFAYLAGDRDDTDIHYRLGDKDFQLTFDGGQKAYLAISPDGLKIAYSLMIEEDGIESYEIFVLDFGQDATIDDLMYRINTCK